MSFAVVAIAGAAVSIGTGIFALSKANGMAGELETLEGNITDAENNRQQLKNPYDNIEDLSGMIKNPYANLGVATKAAEMQAEQSDQALANTLDTLRSGGLGAGGATALAQAAAKSKQGVAASIETQEAQNNKLRAQGEMQQQQMIMAEKVRVQDAEAKGTVFTMQMQEERDNMALDRAQAMYDNASAQQAQYRSDAMGAFSSAGNTAMTAGIGGL
jgi:hypothetical protein